MKTTESVESSPKTSDKSNVGESHPCPTFVANERLYRVLRMFSSWNHPGAIGKLWDIKPVLQNGPQCGLVALQMAASYFHPKEHIETEDIFEHAKEKGYTKQGEMFSVLWLAEIAMEMWPLMQVLAQKLPSPEDLITTLDGCGLVLMPYDCDKNNEPTYSSGRRAHWCIIVGYLYPSDQEGLLWKKSSSESVETLKGNPLYVFCLHGKSKHLALWDYRQLYESNENLLEIDSSRVNGSYMIPSVGLDDLRGLCVVVHAGLCER